jgi:hypothetical protein
MSQWSDFVDRYHLYITIMATMMVVSYCLPELLYLLLRWRRRTGSSRRPYWADLLLPAKLQRDVHHNLDDMMPIWINAHGLRRARKIRRWQLLMMIMGHYSTIVWKAIVKVLEVVRGR